MTTERKDIVSKKRILLDRLFAKLRLGIKPGLERTLQLSEFVGSPHLKIKSIHIAGTNGKGSVASVIASVLTESGYKTGLYTSPHFVDFNERIRINGIKISDEEIVAYADDMLDFAESINCTFFEITTVMAFKYFADKGTDVCVVETGMGGRYDSTNILNPLISIITSIGIDHTEYLGDTLELIASEKAGIIKKNTPCIIGESAEKMSSIFIKAAHEIGTQLIFAGKAYEFENITFHNDFTTTCSAISQAGKKDIVSVVPGLHQLSNLKCSLTCIDEIVKLGYRITDAAILDGIRNVKINTGLIGRIQLLRTNPLLLVDVSHNPEAISELIRTIGLFNNNIKFSFVFAAMADKDLKSMLEKIRPIAKNLLLPELKIDRAQKPHKIAKVASELGFTDIQIFDSTQSAYESILNESTIITGSFYLAGEFFEIFQKS